MTDTRKLIEGIDDPESFDVQGHLTSPVARLASTNGFTRSDRNDREERWVKKLSHGKEVWLRTRPVDPDLDARPFDPKDPHTTGGRPSIENKFDQRAIGDVLKPFEKRYYDRLRRDAYERRGNWWMSLIR